MLGIWGLIGLEAHVRLELVAVALVLQIVIAAALACSAQWEHRQWAGGLLIAAFLVSVALLRAGVGAEATYGSLVLLPILWSAFRRRVDELILSIAGSAGVLFIPILATGGTRYPQSGWRSGGLMVVLATVIGFTVLALMDRQRRDVNQLRALAAGFPQGCFTLFDHDLRYLMAGGPALGDWGHAPGDLEGRTVGEVYDPETAAHLEHRFRAALAGEDQRWEVSEHGRDYDLRAVPVRDAHGRVFAGAVVTVDVTERVQHDAEQQALSRVATVVARGADPPAMFAVVAEEVARLLDSPLVGIVRFDRSTGFGHVVGAAAVSGPDPLGEEIDLEGASAAATVYRTGAPVRIESYSPGRRDSVIDAFGLTGAVCAPISVAGLVWGSIGAAFAGHPVPAGAETRLARFTELVSVAVANAEAWDALRRQAATDPVTGLANHRAFYDHLRAQVRRARREGRRLSVALFDLDHFKLINDLHGHQAGDRVLAEVGLRLGEQVDAGGLLARIGGEEFAWLMPDTGDIEACAAAERARRAIASRPFDGVGPLTISAGVCTRAPGQPAEELMRLADRALYWAKEGGRNATLVHNAENAAKFTAYATPTVERFQTMASVRALARAIDSKDVSTNSHSERVAALAEHLALELGWTAKRARALHAAGLLHDVGKIGISDAILFKATPLTREEREELKRHAPLGGYIAAEALEAEQVIWIRGHHERWDGDGYPDRLGGAEIADGAQLLALADAWDAMTESRIYQPTSTRAQALAECARERGRQFSPDAVDALFHLAERDALPRREQGADPGIEIAFAVPSPVS
ncbi:MAG TPA: diguanylate cyclase [Solirubrobacteraceae bacterium]|nr:diguanylate cyclase [Solirubrobacteraceae bacterium]